MSAAAASSGAPSADAGFGRGTVIGMLLIGLLGFIGLLYALGNDPGGDPNDGGGHAGGKGLNGYAALVEMMKASGETVRQVRSDRELKEPGLLVLTPPPQFDGEKLARIVEERRYVGPTIVVTPKWLAARTRNAQAQKGWVELRGVEPVSWPGFHDELGVSATTAKDNKPAGGWVAGGRRGKLADDRTVMSAAGQNLVPLVESGDGRILAAWIDDGETYPGLEDFIGNDVDRAEEEDNGRFPVILVFEPDLLDNYGLADEQTALLARDLLWAAADETGSEPIRFDLTQNGFGSTQNLLTLAFRPPFLAATICLALAGLAIAWRAFNRFGPPRRRERAIALGKGALVENSAGVIRRTGRIHLVAGPYADAARDRLAAVLGLPRGADPETREAAIDRAQERRGVAGPPFSRAAADLRAARNPHEVAKRAAVLQTIEKALT